jgi:hypothetical protein
MVTWGEVEQAISVLMGKKLNETMWMVELPIGETGRKQQVFVAYEVVQPDMELAKVESPIGFTQNLSIEEVVCNFGDLTIGSIELRSYPGGWCSIYWREYSSRYT